MTDHAAPPLAKRAETRREHHGDVFVDPYEWLRDKDDPEVIAYLEAENAYTDQATAHLEPLRRKIFDEIKARTKETDLSVPTRRGNWWYYARTFEGKQYGVHCRCPVTDPDDWDPPRFDESTEIPGEQVLLDENQEADGHDFFALGALSISLDDNILVYSVDVVGDERYTLQFKDLRTGERYPDEIAGIGPGATWAADHRTVYYTTVDDAWRPDTVWRYRLGPVPYPSRSTTSPTNGFGSRWGAPAATPTSSSRRARRSPPRSATRTRPTQPRSSPSCCRAATASSTPLSTRSSADKIAFSSCTTTVR
ncbi:prolyl oligopeptidase, N-terminal beta-propeller domain protein [Mycobacterium kansasii]|uniref:Prolyl oligopeptidase, N-terminal beta-propeller domain protein n=1 Tax=Mycobacterium kansasii TaxID=1768 RepID=A0A1V3WU38_MYCKA|nr:prolyl oligopeptidase, N-terminal beta-propeller domain protein [Mycobacterium kansasii]